MKHKIYLGDGVYGDLDDSGGITLTTEDGIRVTNSIYFEPEVLAAFEEWISRLRQETTREANRKRGIV